MIYEHEGKCLFGRPNIEKHFLIRESDQIYMVSVKKGADEGYSFSDPEIQTKIHGEDQPSCTSLCGSLSLWLRADPTPLMSM